MADAPGPAPSRPATLLPSDRWRWPETLVWLAAVAAYVAFPDRNGLMAEIVILALFAVSLDLILGYAGIVSLGHAAFFGLGAYTAGLIAVHGWTEPLTGLAFTGLFVALGGFLTSFLVLRGSDLTRLMVTLGVAMMLGEAASKAAWLTGGTDGLTGIVMAPLLGVFEFDFYGRTAAAYATIVLFALFLLARRLVASPFGTTLRGIKSNSLRMTAIGTPVNAYLVAVYTISAGYAGIAGAMLAQTTQFVSPEVLAFHRSAEVLLFLIIGGTGYLYGGILGAVAFKFLQEFLSGLTAQYWQFWLGLILVVLVLFARGGLKGLAVETAGRWRRRRTAATREAPP
jgi:branched-chain amino acid transport system permease protein